MHKTKRVAVVIALMGSACAGRTLKKEPPRAPLVETSQTSNLLEPVRKQVVVEISKEKKKDSKKPEERPLNLILADLGHNEKRYDAMYELSGVGISKLKDEERRKITEAVLKSMSYDVEVHAPGVLVLGRLGVPPSIIDNYSKHADSRVRVQVAKTLGNYQSPDAVYILINLTGDKLPKVVHVAIESLARIGKNATEPLVNVLINGNVDQKDAAVEALSMIGRDAVPRVTTLLGNPDKNVAYRAITVLGNVGNDFPVASLIEMLSHNDSHIRGIAANALRKIGHKEALAALRIVADNDPSDFVRAAAKVAVEELSK